MCLEATCCGCSLDETTSSSLRVKSLLLPKLCTSCLRLDLEQVVCSCLLAHVHMYMWSFFDGDINSTHAVSNWEETIFGFDWLNIKCVLLYSVFLWSTCLHVPCSTTQPDLKPTIIFNNKIELNPSHFLDHCYLHVLEKHAGVCWGLIIISSSLLL